jgi:hypothetical protein
MSVTQIREQLARIQRTVPGVKSAYAYPPDGAIGPLPAFINRMDSGEFTTPRMMGWRETVHVLKAICLVQYQGELADAERKIENIVYEFTNTLDHAKTLGDTERVLDADVLRYESGPFSMANQDQPFIAVSFDVQVREIETPVVYSAAG